MKSKYVTEIVKIREADATIAAWGDVGFEVHTFAVVDARKAVILFQHTQPIEAQAA
jgi:hypothetical protein